jgi:heptosyltransferase-2
MKVLVIQNRMGIGDMIIFLPYIYAISKHFNKPVSLLVKENTKSLEFLSNNPDIEQIIILDRNDKKKIGRHYGLKGIINLATDIKKHNFDKVFIFNSSLRYSIIARLAKIKSINQYQLFNKKNQNIIETAKLFIKKTLNIEVESNPIISINQDDINIAKNNYKIINEDIKILLGVGGSGPTKRVPTEKILEFMKLCNNKFKCKFFIAAGSNEIEEKIVNQILNSEFKNKCVAINKLKISETLPIIKNCNISICNDTSFSHLSAALGLKTIVLMTDTPLLYGNYSPRMYPILPDGEKNVTHDTLGKDKINPIKIFDKMKVLLNLS